MLMFGTGDREQPRETEIHNRIYAVIDPYTDSKASTYKDINTAALDERDLLNVTNDELDVDSGYGGDDPTVKEDLFCDLSKTYGWYIKLDEISDSYIHDGEKVLSQPLIFFGRAYITTFTPNLSDPCYPHGEAKIYGLNYCNGTAGLNYYLGNDETSDGVYTRKFDYRDRYRAIGEAIPSSPKIIIREGTVAAFSSVGGGLPGLGEQGSSKIPQPKFGINMINWFSSQGNQ
jgi:type IV pilus assembly protein PilY1